MEQWLKISLLLCTFGFLKEIRPSEPFITNFITGEWRNITDEQVNREIFPVGTYSYLAQLVIVFLITDFLRYKPLIVVSGISGIIVWSMLLWTTTLRELQILEVFYGTYMATEVAYFTYIYAKVERQYYQKVTSHTRAAILSGKFIAAVLAQILVYYKLMDYRELNYLSLAAQIMATCWAFALPAVKTSLYFHRPTDNQKLVAAIQAAADSGYDGLHRSSSSVGIEVLSSTTIERKQNKFVGAFQLLWLHFRSAYTNKQVLQWSAWYALGMCTYIQIVSYIQVLWNAIEDDEENLWNGAVEAILTLLSAGVSLLAGYFHTSQLTQRSSLLTLVILSVLEGLAVLLAAQTSLLWISYLGYILFGTLYAFTITVVSAEVAKNLTEDSFGLVFGINTLVALALQTILTILVVSENGFRLDAVGQFSVYGYYYVGIGAIYLVALLADMFSDLVS